MATRSDGWRVSVLSRGAKVIGMFTLEMFADLMHTIRSMKDGKSAKPNLRFGQFRISSALSWTAVAGAAMATVSGKHIASFEDMAFLVFIFCVFLFPPLSCVPFLVDQLLKPVEAKPNALSITSFGKVRLVMFVGIYSILMLLASTNAFNATWKGHKGHHWIYYVLESYPAMTLWPTYGLGGAVFIAAVCNANLAARSPLVFLIVSVQAVVSLWYTFACLFLDFSNGEFTVVPGSCAACYSLYAAVLFKNRMWSLEHIKQQWLAIVAVLSTFLGAVIAKYPLARAYFDQLPDEPPDNCFVVTAATRGHRGVVRTWYEESLNRVVNRQLINFWEFEDWLRVNFPSTQIGMRKVYNFIGPLIARLIVFKWQADLVYWALKPAEWLAKMLARKS